MNIDIAQENQQDMLREKGRVALILTSVTAMLRRDILVMCRAFPSFIGQVLLQPFFFLFTLGVVLPTIGIATHSFGSLLFPGIVALTVFVTSVQGVALPLTIELGYIRTIEDRLLAPVPISFVAIEKVLFAVFRGLLAGSVIFPLAFLMLRHDFYIRVDAIGWIVVVMIIAALTGAALGLVFGTVVSAEHIALGFSVFFPPLIFTGCVQYPWGILDRLRWFQVVTLINPLTYASEGLRSTIVPHSQNLPTLGLSWSLAGLFVFCCLFLFLGIRTFCKRVVN